MAAALLVAGGASVMVAPAASAARLADVSVSCGGSGVASYSVEGVRGDSVEGVRGDYFVLQNTSGEDCLLSGDVPPLVVGGPDPDDPFSSDVLPARSSLYVRFPDAVGTWVLSGRDFPEQTPGFPPVPGTNGFDITITVRSPNCPVLSGSMPYTVSPAPGPGLRWDNCELADSDMRNAVLSSADLRLANLSGADLTGVTSFESDLTFADLSGANLTGARMRATVLNGANLTGVTWLDSQLATSTLYNADLSGTDLQNANFVDNGSSDLSQANLSYTDLRGVRFATGRLIDDRTKNAYLEGVDFTGAMMANLNLIKGNLAGSLFTKTNLSGSTLAYADLRGAAGSDTDLSGAIMTGAVLELANFPRANMYAVLLDKGNLNGAQLAQGDLSQGTLFDADLTDANLSGANMTSINLSGAMLLRTNLSHPPSANRSLSAFAAEPPAANLTDANLTDANLTGADLSGADLSGAELSGADLTDVSGRFVGTPDSMPTNFRIVNGYLVGPNADLSGADLTGADLSGAELTGADLTAANLAGANLSGASGCEIRGLPINLPLGYSIENACLTYTLVVSEFAAPVDAGMVNKAKAGQTVPFKFTVTDVSGTPITDLTTLTTTATAYTCESGQPTDAIEEYSAGGSGLQNFGDGSYQFNFKTQKSWAGTCRTLGIELGDGVKHTAKFQFR